MPVMMPVMKEIAARKYGNNHMIPTFFQLQSNYYTFKRILTPTSIFDTLHNARDSGDTH